MKPPKYKVGDKVKVTVMNKLVEGTIIARRSLYGNTPHYYTIKLSEPGINIYNNTYTEVGASEHDLDKINPKEL